MKTSWDRILHILQKNLNPGLFKIWISPLSAVIRDDHCELVAPNEFVASGVRDRLLTTVTQAASDVLGRPATVTVSTRPRSTALHPTPPSADPAVQRPIALPTPAATPPAALPPAPAPRTAPAWRFSFDDFVVGPCNELAFAASQGLCRKTLLSDQLILCSSPGLGKTHLLQAIGRSLTAIANTRAVRVRYLTAEEFATRMVLALKMREMDRFKAEFRDHVDILLLEDIHFLQGKEKIQDELLATLKALREHGSKIVLTSSFLPRELSGVDRQLASRFCAGLLAVIEHPDLDTRMRIVSHKARTRYQVDVPEDVSALLAQRIQADIRTLESCLQSLVLKAKLLNRQITTELALETLRNYEAKEAGPDLAAIIRAVCQNFRLSQDELSSKSRKQNIVIARNTAFYLARKHTGLSLEDIGQEFNRRHSTVIKGITKLEREIAQQTPLGRQITHTINHMNL
jgi:chromosomal replication initiator protein